MANVAYLKHIKTKGYPLVNKVRREMKATPLGLTAECGDFLNIQASYDSKV